MKTLKYMMLTLVLATMTTTAEAKLVCKDHMYMFGLAASFVDSTLYLTDIQDVVGAWYDTKDKALMGRDSYSFQLKEYMADKMGQTNRVCLVIFATTLKKVEKKYMKLKKKYMLKDGTIPGMRYLTAADFKFEAVDVSDK